jgi:hypothetical protein
MDCHLSHGRLASANETGQEEGRQRPVARRPKNGTRCTVRVMSIPITPMLASLAARGCIDSRNEPTIES